MENPFAYNARQLRRGVKNFRRCDLKQVTAEHYPTWSYHTQTDAILLSCPTLEDTDSEPIVMSNTNVTETDQDKQLKDAQCRLERYCGASICADCVYTSLETPVQVNIMRKEDAETKLAAVQARLALEQAVEELDVLLSPPTLQTSSD